MYLIIKKNARLMKKVGEKENLFSIIFVQNTTHSDI